ncbi:MAG: MFS transporter, partial [Thiotrichaceae bacterium]|nr:MFS transporter [Thiotrichaceae bacterium]
ELKKINNDIDNIAIALPNRKIVHSLQPQFKGHFLADTLVIDPHKTIETQKISDRYHLVLPLQTRDTLHGVIDLSFKQSLVNARVNAIIMDNLAQLALTILIAACVLLVGLYILLATSRFTLSKRKLYVFLLIVLGSAQLFYSSYNIEFFKKNYSELAQGKVKTLSKALQSDLNTFLKVINLNRLVKVDVLMGRVAKAAPEIESIQISNLENKPLYRVDQVGFSNLQTQQQSQAILNTENTPYQIVLPLQNEVQSAQTVGYLTVKISQAVLQQKINEIILDSVTVVIISFLFLTELMIFLLIFINRQILSVQQPHLQTQSDIYHVARPATFIYIFSAMLCYSFLPLYVEQIYQPMFGLAKNFVLGLPLSAEIFFAGLSLMPAGILIDKKGWYRGFLIGISLSLLGTLLSGFAHNPLEFIVYRGIVGVGYAFCWMSLQGFVINSTNEDNRAQGITYLIAAVFSGTICGSAIGGMLAQHLGFSAVFFIAVIVMFLSLIFIMLFMRQHNFHTEGALQPTDKFIWADLWRFLRDRNVLVMFSCSLIPFSVAMVGIIYYAGPIYLSQIGTSQSNIGRVIMVFGLCVIYLAPMMSRLIDKSSSKKHYISLSGLVGALGLVIFQVPLGFWNVFFAILLLGISSSLGASSRNIFILNLPISKSFGVTKVMGIYRSVDKLGQTLGPILLGALAVILGGIEAAIVASGMIYLLLTLLFIFGVPKETDL